MFDRIVSTPDVLRGKPCIRGTRISVEHILELMASGATRDEVLRAYPQLSAEDVEQGLRFAADVLRNEVVIAAEVSR